MEGFDVEEEIKQASETLNKETIKSMDKCLQELTTSGSPSLDVTIAKKFKRFCRESDDYVRYAFLLIMRQLKKRHSEIRLSAFQVADELFNRSHAFREILVIHLQPFLALTTETELKRPLPPPKAAANRLKSDTLHALQQWYDKYGQGYRKLAIGYEYLKNCRHVDFNNIRAQNLAERQRLENEEKRKQKIMAERLKKVLKDIAELKPEIEDCAKEAESCLQLLLPTPTDFLLDLPEVAHPGAGDSGSATFNSAARSKSTSSKKCSDPKADSDEAAGGSDRTGKLSEAAPTTLTSPAAGSSSIENMSSSQSTCSECGTNRTTVKSDQSESSKKGWRTPESAFQEQQVVGVCKCSTGTASISDSPNGVHNVTGNQIPKENISDIERTSKNEGSTHGETEEEDSDADLFSDDEPAEELQAHGLAHPSHALTLEIPAPGPVSVQVTTDNKDVVRCLKDASKLINSNYLPTVIKWLEILGKNGGKESDIKTAIDLKVHLENIKVKCIDLKLVAEEETNTLRKDQNDSDDDDFEEVPEKEGYEPRIPRHLRAEYGLVGDSVQDQGKHKPPAAATEKDKSSTPTNSQGSVSSQPLASSSKQQHWSLRERIETQDTSDPTSLAGALARIKPESLQRTPERRLSSSLSSSGTSISDQEQDKSAVPIVEFGTDLAHWENPDEMEAPSIVKYDSLHRFWAPKDVETEKPSQHDLASARNRTFTFIGKFEPVKWKCRAPMPNGKLCERMDRVKCPFHGKIIARDEQGNPCAGDLQQASTSGEVKVKSETAEITLADGELPPWQDPELQREIEAATGKDLGSARSQKLLDKEALKKGKGKGKGRKKSNLTDLKAIQNTSRKRLEDKVFNKGAMRRVCSTLDRADYKRVRDKFGNQFNYSLK